MNGIYNFLKGLNKYTKNADILIAVALIGILVVMLVPVPALLIDMFLTFSFTASLLILLVSIYTIRPLEFSVFPSMLLITTLFRLSLNVASTRRILVHGHEGGDAAGGVIQAFGSFVVGDNYIVGMIVFIILVVINFVVITKGSGRVAEVAARFTLDAMPGKQMSIDADLNAGLINDDEARKRRKSIEAEADFYGAMDGASKFVRGDAIAGILITLVNIVGGLLIGVIQRSMDIGVAAQTYTKLTIGEGLVAQIPALIISTAAGIVVTRASSDKNLGREISAQLFVHPKAIGVVSVILGVFGIMPGMPALPFLFFGAVGGTMAWVVSKMQKEEAVEVKRKTEEAALKPDKEKIESLLPLDMLELEVGYSLINIVDSDQSGDLLERIVSIRKQFAMDLGIVVPSVHIRDNLTLQPGDYQILIKGVKVAGGGLMAEHYLAMDPGNVTKRIEGVDTVEPAFGLPALWISKSQKEEAELAGYTVVDLPTVIATHLTEVIRTHAHELLGRQEAQRLIESFQKTNPKVVEELIPNLLPLGGVVRVMQNLLREQVSIRDLLTIFETLADEAPKTKDAEVLTESVRKALSRGITKKYTNEDGQVAVMSLDRRVEEVISNSLLQTEQGVQLVLDPQYAQQVLTALSKVIENNPVVAGQPILLTSPTIRRHLRKLTERFIPQLVILSHNELIPTANVKSVDVVRLEMQVKKFEAKSIKEALQMVKQELGPEAIIISAKDNKKSFGLAGQGSIEVTAAISEKSLQQKKFAENKLTVKDKEKFKNQTASFQKKFIDTTVNKYEQRRKQAAQSKYGGIAFGSGAGDGLDDSSESDGPATRRVSAHPRPPTATRYIDIADETGEVTEAKVLGKRVDDILEAFEFSADEISQVRRGPAQAPVQTAPAQNNAEVTSLKMEVQQLKDMLAQFSQGNNNSNQKRMTQHPGAEYGLPFELSHQFEKLQTAGLDTHYIVEILEKANNELTLIDKRKKTLVDAWVARFIMSNTEVVGRWNNEQKLQLFMGPSGHGKTSTLIKMASHYALNEKKRVVILTADTFKVGAYEQLKIFCQILNVPLETIKHSIEYDKLLAKYNQFDMVLVDYPGMSLRDIGEIDRLRALMPNQDMQRTTHLVLSANCKDIDGYEMAQRYGVSHFDDVILTKIDESFTHGFLYNIQHKTQKPLYIFGTGSKIPEDLEIATRERVLDLIYKITKNSF